MRIEINLAPEHLRKKKQSNLLHLKTLRIPREAIIGLVGGLLVLLILVHIVLLVMMFSRLAKYNQLKGKWESIAAQKKDIDVVLNELRSIRGRLGAVEQVTTEERLFWAAKLNDISDSISRGVWLNKITLDGKVLIIDGTAVSRSKNEIESVGTFVSNLKEKKYFNKGLKNIDVGSIQRRTIQSVEVADFLITIKVE